MVYKGVWQCLESQKGWGRGRTYELRKSRDEILKRKSLLGQGCFCIILLSPGGEEIIILGVCCTA